LTPKLGKGAFGGGAGIVVVVCGYPDGEGANRVPQGVFNGFGVFVADVGVAAGGDKEDAGKGGSRAVGEEALGDVEGKVGAFLLLPRCREGHFEGSAFDGYGNGSSGNGQ
jgi:hypothetical protein